MLMDRVPGQAFGALVDHFGGWRGRSDVRGPPLNATDLLATRGVGSRRAHWRCQARGDLL